MFSGLQGLMLLVLVPLIDGCGSLNQLVHTLPYISSPGSICTTDTDCSSVNCTLIYQDVQSIVGLTVKSCRPEPRVELRANIPKLGVRNWSGTFNDQTELTIPGLFLPVTSGLKLQTRLHILLTSPAENILLLSLSIRGCKSSDREDCEVDKRVLQAQPLTCKGPPLTNTRPAVQCSITNLFDCPEDETCQQIVAELGECQCLKGYQRNHNGTCTLTVATEPPPPASTIPDSEVPEIRKLENANLVINIMLPIVILALVAAIGFAAYRHGLLVHLKNRYGHRSFDELSVADQDDVPVLA